MSCEIVKRLDTKFSPYIAESELPAVCIACITKAINDPSIEKYPHEVTFTQASNTDTEYYAFRSSDTQPIVKVVSATGVEGSGLAQSVYFPFTCMQ